MTRMTSDDVIRLVEEARERGLAPDLDGVTLSTIMNATQEKK